MSSSCNDCEHDIYDLKSYALKLITLAFYAMYFFARFNFQFLLNNSITEDNVSFHNVQNALLVKI